MEITQAEYDALIAVAIAAHKQAEADQGETLVELDDALARLNWVDVTPFGATRREFLLGAFPPHGQ